MLINGDCHIELNAIKDNSVDLILTDPPYELINWNNPLKWDKKLDMEHIWIQIERILKPRSAVLLFGNEPYSSWQRYTNMQWFKYDWVWAKNYITSPLLAKVKPLKSYELISVFSNGTTSPGRDSSMRYYPQGTESIHKKHKGKKENPRSMMDDRPSLRKDYLQDTTGYPRDILFF